LIGRLVTSALLGVTIAAHAQAETGRSPALFAIAVGYNWPDDRTLPVLQYADDDAARYYSLVTELGGRAVLLTRFDRASQTLYRGLRPTSPSYGALSAALGAINREVDAERRRGRETVLYLFYSGHGDVHRGEGYVQLRDRRLYRSALLKLLGRSHADVNHVIVDACKSYFVVFRRGPGGRRRPVSGRLLVDEEGVSSSTGFLLSTSSSQESHEWEAYQGGIFSHEIRSALRGAADLDGDGRVTYEEAAAFIFTANMSVPNQRYRPRFFVRPRAGRQASRAVLIDLRAVKGRRIVFGSGKSRHFFVEDERGVRIADLHPGRRRVSVLVPPGKLFVRDPGSSLEYAVPPGTLVALRQLTPRRLTSRPRGAAHESFRRLFDRAYTGEMVVLYRRRPVDVVEDPSRLTTTDWLRPTVGLTGLAALAAGGVLSGLAVRSKGTVGDETSQTERGEVNRSIRRYNIAAVTCYVVGGLAAAGYLLWRLWPQDRVRITVGAAPGAGRVDLRMRW
jgi:hypothetical protein